MYSDKENVLQLVALAKAYGIYQVVLSPGSRNSPLIHSFACDPDFQCYSIVDERSAGFFALGLIMQSRQPVAVCCTSGTAVLNLGPAVAEAFYQQLPLVVITADRPAAWIGQMDGQTLPQPHIFGRLVKHSVQLPECTDSESRWYCNRLINEALSAVNHHGYGPVQINIPLSEPLFNYTVEHLPDVRKITRHLPACENNTAGFPGLGRRFISYKRPMLLVGQLLPDKQQANLLAKLSEKEACVVLAEHLANVTGSHIVGNFDPVLYALPEEQATSFAPDLLITLGGHVVSKRVKQFLRRHQPLAHWHISETGEITDLYQSLTEVFECNASRFLRELLEQLSGTNQTERKMYQSAWQRYNKQIPLPTPSFSDLAVIGAVMEQLPAGAALHLANSSTIRYSQLYPLQPGIEVYCNRGTSGIEGSVSTAAGYAAAAGQPVYLFTGDLSFFYDINGLWNRYTRANLRILLNNNAGGEIFYALPGLNRSEALEAYIAASHTTRAQAWAEATGFLYLPVTSEKELQENLPIFTTPDHNKPVLMEVITSKEENTRLLRTYYHSIKTK
ncbi:MAG: 2-succinyl-5-enolpyruvyl-6-hydroxy-3-cyclohexene-1-carboxylic-acid synthase [Tannerellaceae bacterium]|nr:2-succinyl-5-enolpyruvyl-6-hydroxy-3-cyclohexene-1-carboxylic-acid synthase [Tannerellaceae bacterium]